MGPLKAWRSPTSFHLSSPPKPVILPSIYLETSYAVTSYASSLSNRRATPAASPPSYSLSAAAALG